MRGLVGESASGSEDRGGRGKEALEYLRLPIRQRLSTPNDAGPCARSPCEPTVKVGRCDDRSRGAARVPRPKAVVEEMLPQCKQRSLVGLAVLSDSRPPPAQPTSVSQKMHNLFSHK